LFIGGPGVALGYHALPELTAERFVENPFRLSTLNYRTGDRARWLADGTIDYLGRIDRQIKLRGFRIEPGEIENALRNQPGIADCVVRVCEFAPGDRRLVAWFQPSNGRTPPDAELTRGLARVLPDYMVPSALVAVERFPLNTNGKLDIAALPSPSSAPLASATETAPENTIQAQLVEIWQEVLGVPRVGIHDDFFTLGGHSLLAARMLALVEQRLGLRVPLATLFTGATIAHLGQTLLAGCKDAAEDSPYVALHAKGEGTPFFFLHGDFVGGGVFSQNLARHLGSDRPFYAIHPHGLRGEMPPRTIEMMARARLETIRALRPQGPYLLGGYCNGALVAFEIARLLEADGERVEAMIMIAADGSNVRYRRLHAWAARVGTVLRESDEEVQQRALRWQRGLRLGEAFLEHYRQALRDLARLPLGERADRIGKKLRRVLHRLHPRTLDHPAIVRPDLRSDVAAAYEDVWDSYLPGPFGGRISLLWPHDDRALIPSGPTAGWEKVCAEVELIDVPGGHHNCITQDSHLRSIAGHLRLILDRADTRALAASRVHS
jgi:thioesterase domain-containing protein